MPKLNHVSIAVRDIRKFAELYSRLFGIQFSSPRQVESQKVELSFAQTEGVKRELISPGAADSPVGKFLDQRGEGLHHICLEVQDIEQTVADLKEKGVEILGQPSVGGSGKKIVFLHPKSTGGVLIELKES
jgi:methylmalonyl-CoA epimerase